MLYQIENIFLNKLIRGLYKLLHESQYIQAVADLSDLLRISSPTPKPTPRCTLPMASVYTGLVLPPISPPAIHIPRPREATGRQ